MQTGSAGSGGEGGGWRMEVDVAQYCRCVCRANKGCTKWQINLGMYSRNSNFKEAFLTLSAMNSENPTFKV